MRLKSELERYLCQNEQNKHRYFLAENARKEMEALCEVKKEELKQTLKRLQQEKVTVAELRHQLKEKDRGMTKIIADLQKVNHDIS